MIRFLKIVTLSVILAKIPALSATPIDQSTPSLRSHVENEPLNAKISDSSSNSFEFVRSDSSFKYDSGPKIEQTDTEGTRGDNEEGKSTEISRRSPVAPLPATIAEVTFESAAVLAGLTGAGAAFAAFMIGVDDLNLAFLAAVVISGA